ncbi:MAG: alpha/beta hydrolase [Azospirillaceae bacterium]
MSLDLDARKTVTTNDGVTLRYLEAGSGRPLIMIPGWSQTVAEFRENIPALADQARVLAVDMRGHGESDKPRHGYRVSRLAADLHDMIEALDLSEVTLLGHSMGSSVAWCYLETYGADRIAGLVVVDQAPCCIAKPGWSEAQCLDYGVLMPNPQGAYDLYAMLTSPEAEAETPGFLRGMFTDALDDDTFGFVVAENLKMPRRYGADLVFDHLHNDWRDAIARITLPTLVIGAEASIFSAQSQRWIAGTIPGAAVDIVPAAEGGSHFMFLENARRFNERVGTFLAG